MSVQVQQEARDDTPSILGDPIPGTTVHNYQFPVAEKDWAYKEAITPKTNIHCCNSLEQLDCDKNGNKQDVKLPVCLGTGDLQSIENGAQRIG